MARYKELILLFLLLSFYTVQAYSNTKPHVVNLYKERYRASNKNWSIGQDERGFMYFGNDIGLLEFDGIEWKLNQLPNSQVIRSVAVLSNETIFTGSYEEFGRWDRDISGRLVYTSLSDSLDKSLFQNNDFWKIWITDGAVYFQSFSSIFVYDYKTVTPVLYNDNILFLTKVRNEFLVQRISGALYFLKDHKLVKIEGSDIFSATDVRVILPYEDDKYLIGTTSKGVFVYDGKSIYELSSSLSEEMKAKELSCGLLSSKGNYFLGTILDGIYEVDTSGKIINHISSAATLQDNTVLSLFEDDLNNIWAALDKGIAYILYLDNFSCYVDPRGSTGAIYDATMWNNKLFIGTNQGVFYIDEKNVFQTDALTNKKFVDNTQGQVWSFAQVDGKLYCCHNKELKEIHKDLKVTTAYTTNSGVYNLTEANLNGQDIILLSTYISLKVVNKGTGDIYSLSEINEPIINTEVDHLGNIWMEHANRGVYRCRLSDDLRSFTRSVYYGGDSKDGLPYKMKIFKIGGRIVLLGDNKFYTYDDIEDKIVSNTALDNCFKDIKSLKHIIFIKNNVFWALTNTSLYKFEYDGSHASILESYSLSIGLSLVNAYENISILNDSANIICLDNGFLLYKENPDLLQKQMKKKQLISPYLESVRTIDQNNNITYLDLSGNTEIPYNYNIIDIGFSAKNTFASNLSFQYMLLDVEYDWSEAGKINHVSYARLPKGKYTFMVRTLDHLGNHSEPTFFHFEILPPWYETIWAYLLYILLTLVVLYGIWALVLRRYRNLHLQKIRSRETRRLRMLTEELQSEVEQKSAELLTQTSFIIRKNELIFKIRDIIYELYDKNKSSTSLSLYQKVNALINNNLNSDDDWKMFLIKFEEKHTGFFKKLKVLYPQLTNTDLRLCACLRLNLETKEIASLMNLSIRAVENSRYRLRKKLNIKSSQNLNEFFMGID
jgi:DNA-binding CsgD family transcriptional regulator